MKYQALVDAIVIDKQKNPVRKLPLFDKMKFDNMTMNSVAEKKRMWKGKRGKFKVKELVKWFKVYDETKLYEARNGIERAKHRKLDMY